MSGLELIQGSDEWRAYKCGKVSASRISDVLAKGKGITRAAYLAEIVVERLTGVFTQGFENADTRRGREEEPQARAAYSFMTGNPVQAIGFVDHPSIAMSGASPDGRVGDVGLVEFKCTKPHVHLEYLDGAPMPKDYRDQIQWALCCENRAWCDFASFSPSYPAGMDLHIRRIHRDDEALSDIEREVRKFIAEVDAKVAALRARYGQEEAA